MEKLSQPLWEPSPSQIQDANLTSFIQKVNDRHDLKLSTFESLHHWSVSHIQDFWKAVWDFCGLITSQTGKRDVHFPQGLFKPEFFTDAKLNFAENLLRPRASDTPAIIFWGEDKIKRTLTFADVYQEVARLAAYLKSLGVQKGDRIGGYVPNTPQAVIAMLATTSLGAIWSSCSTDFGVSAVIDRFGQITPKILFMADGYYYNNKRFNCMGRVDELTQGLPTLEKVIICPYVKFTPYMHLNIAINHRAIL